MHIRIIMVLLGIGMFLPVPPAHAASVVGDGTPASCTRDALATALASGGEIRFNCGSAPVTIPIAATLDIRTAATIDGGGLVTLDGQGTTRIMYVNKLSAGTKLTLRNLTLANGRSSTSRPACRQLRRPTNACYVCAILKAVSRWLHCWEAKGIESLLIRDGHGRTLTFPLTATTLRQILPRWRIWCTVACSSVG